MKVYLEGGMKWEEIPVSHGGSKKWASENHKYEIFLTRTGKYRLVAFDHDPSTQFPDAEFWMREYDTLNLALHQAESM